MFSDVATTAAYAGLHDCRYAMLVAQTYFTPQLLRMSDHSNALWLLFHPVLSRFNFKVVRNS